MTRKRLNDALIIWGSIFVGLLLQIMPWPEALSSFKPSWLLLVMFYWTLALPHRVNVGSGLIIGLIWDLLLGSTLGIRGMAVSILSYLTAANFQVIRNLALWQQATIFAIFIVFAKLLIFMFELLTQNVSFNANSLLSVFVNFLLWPWFFFLMRRIRQTCNIT